MKAATLVFSDLHPDDVDFTRPDKHGNTGERLFRVFIDWVWHLLNEGISVTLIGNGDCVNCVAYLAEALVKQAWIFRELEAIDDYVASAVTGGTVRGHVIFVPGNHDKRLTGASLLCYHHEPWMKRIGEIWIEHGHRLDPNWSEMGALNTWVGEHIIKRGTQIERKWPLFDEAFLRVGRLFLPKGHAVSDDAFVSAALKIERVYQTSRVGFGHTHRALYTKVPGCFGHVTVFNTHSWVPSPSDSKDGWYERGDVTPFVYWSEKDWFMQATAGGMKHIAGGDNDKASLSLRKELRIG